MLDDDIVYRFDMITFIPNVGHNNTKNNNTKNRMLTQQGIEKIKFIHEYWKVDDNDHENHHENNRLCIIKNTKDVMNCTNDGTFPYNVFETFAKKNNINIVVPSLMNENEFICKIKKSEYLVLTWETAFYKNYVYISDKCKKIIIIIH
jgi:hypothetical protein